MVFRIKMNFVKFVSFTAISALAHSDLPQMLGAVPYPPPPALSYHFHIVFNLSDPTALTAAEALRGESRVKFAELLGADCVATRRNSGRYDNGRLCLIYDHDISEVLSVGPFASGEWSMFVPVPYLDAVLFWFTQNYKNVPTASLLQHPNTGYAYEDHSEWAMWAGLA